MKIKVIIILIIFSIIGCTNSRTMREKKWKKFTFFKNKKEYSEIDWSLIEVGDILIKQADGNYLQWFGHSGIVVSGEAVAEIPKLGETVYLRDINDWKKMNRVAILRWKGHNNFFNSKLIDNVADSLGKKYKITSKKDSSGYYCSQYIWNMYYVTGKEFEINIDIDSNGGYFVLPADILYSEELEIVDIME